MIKAGIDKLALYTPRYAFDLAQLAYARAIPPNKFTEGLGQFTMSVPPPGEDVVTMAANAAKVVLQDVDVNQIEMLLFATESGIDQSKAAGIYVHDLLKLPARCRVVELKQACYSATAGLQLALPFLRENPQKKVLLIASDIARYGLNTPGESSQGAGAIAMILSAQPRILVLEPEYGVITENVMDFWRPNYRNEALVEGKYSSKLYLSMLEKSFQQYRALSGRNFHDHAYYCYHIPVPRLVEKAHQHLLKLNGVMQEEGCKQLNYSLDYARKVGNCYSASLYIGLVSLLELAPEDLGNARIGFYSYGSGCVAEYFSGVVQPGYKDYLETAYHAKLLRERKQISYEEYADFYGFQYVQDGSDQDIPSYETGGFCLGKLEKHKRIYALCHPREHCHSREGGNPSIRCETANGEMDPRLRGDDKVRGNDNVRGDDNVQGDDNVHTDNHPTSPQTQEHVLKVCAPGKLILSGEYAVVYNHPALAMAINRYVTATVTRESRPQILFDLADLAHHSHLSFNALKALKERLKRKYHRFVRGDFSIREVLQKPFELVQFALGIFAEALNLSLPHGVKIQIQSDIPIGCGMGSSAATIVSVMHAISNYLQVPVSGETLYQIALEAENMQHGRSSGLDLRVALQGGCILVNGNDIEARPIPNLPMYLVNTGMPITSTGQCVEKVAPLFRSSQLGDEFASITRNMDSALQQNSWQKLRESVRDNHQLLTRIGVVPERVQQFVSQVETSGGAAKICGAGAVSGNHAGALLVLSGDKNELTSLCMEFDYNVIPIVGEMRGVHAA